MGPVKLTSVLYLHETHGMFQAFTHDGTTASLRHCNLTLQGTIPVPSQHSLNAMDACPTGAAALHMHNVPLC